MQHKTTTKSRKQLLADMGLKQAQPELFVPVAQPQAVTEATPQPDAATGKQLNFLGDLCNQLRDNHHTTVHQIEVAMEKGLSRDQASRCIDGLVELRKHTPKQQANTNSEPEAGMYRLADGAIVRVYLGQNSGKMLAKQLVSEGEHHSYEYMGKATRFVDSTTAKLTLAEAKEFGRMTGTCCCCARRLDVPESVEAGIGPVCARKLVA